MEKSELLLNNFSVLSKNPLKNSDALKSLVVQLCEENPQLAIRCWHEILINNIDKLKDYWGAETYPYNSVGRVFIYDFLYDIMGEETFKYALDYFIKDKDLLDIVYTKTVFDADFRIAPTGKCAINYLLKHKNFKSAEMILAAIYKNKTFSFYDRLWEEIINEFQYSDTDKYSGGVWMTSNYKQDEDIQNFCLEWSERIIDEEQKAAALTFIMRIC